MLVALSGSHGTGKTTTARALCQRLPGEWGLFREYYRDMTAELGYQTPREAVTEDAALIPVSSTAICASALAAEYTWCKAQQGQGVIDMGPLAVMAYHYYWMVRVDMKVSPYLRRLCLKAASLIDCHVYLPVGVIPLVADGVRTVDSEFQLEIDYWIKRLIQELGIADNKILHVHSVDLDDRIQEITGFLKWSRGGL